MVEEVLKEMTDFIAKPASENILATSFKTRAAEMEAKRGRPRRFSSARGDGNNEQSLSGVSKLIDYFHEVLPKTTADDGVWKLPDGDAFYAYKLREYTTTRLNPNEVHELGLREVARIESEMRAILDANGYTGQPIGEAMDKLTKDGRFLYPNDDKGVPTPWRNTQS